MNGPSNVQIICECEMIINLQIPAHPDNWELSGCATEKDKVLERSDDPDLYKNHTVIECGGCGREIDIYYYWRELNDER